MPPGGGGDRDALSLILGAIEAEGPIPFERFLELALYHPRAGYYRRGDVTLRDYITAPRLSAVFGRLLGRFVDRASRLIPGSGPGGCAGSLVVLEPGAGSGWLAAAAAAEMTSRLLGGELLWVSSDINAGGKGPADAAFCRVAAAGVSCFGPLPRGMVVANELFDALPCRVVEFRRGEWLEVLVGAQAGRLVEVLGPAPSPELSAYLSSRDLPRVEGNRLEINLAARNLILDLSRVVERGFLIIIDYGGTSGDLAERAHTGGTIRAFRGHTVSGDVLTDPGSCDLTADVNFTDLIRWGAEHGWETVYEGSQRDFLLGLGLMEEVAALSRDINGPERLAAYLSAKRFLMPEGLQERFRVLILGRGLSLPASEAGSSLWN